MKLFCQNAPGQFQETGRLGTERGGEAKLLASINVSWVALAC